VERRAAEALMTQPWPEFAPPSPDTAGDDTAAATTLLEAPTRQTIALHKLAPEAAMRRLELTIVRRLEGF
jgi:hypothetical protein